MSELIGNSKMLVRIWQNISVLIQSQLPLYTVETLWESNDQHGSIQSD